MKIGKAKYRLAEYKICAHHGYTTQYQDYVICVMSIITLSITVKSLYNSEQKVSVTRVWGRTGLDCAKRQTKQVP
jgi:hypothetical protein